MSRGGVWDPPLLLHEGKPWPKDIRPPMLLTADFASLEMRMLLGTLQRIAVVDNYVALHRDLPFNPKGIKKEETIIIDSLSHLRQVKPPGRKSRLFDRPPYATYRTVGYDGTPPKETSKDHFHKTIVMAWEKK